MMNITFKKLAGYEENYNSSLGYDTVGMIYFYGKSNELEQIKELFSNFKTYNVIPGLTYKDCELHLWSSQDLTHMQLSFQSNKNGEKRNRDIYDQIFTALNNEFNSLSIDVVIGEDYALSSDKIEDFLLNYQIDIDKIPFEKFKVIKPHVVGFPKLSDIALNKLEETEKEILQNLEGKKVIINRELKGSFKKLNNRYVFFKMRARKTYYNINLSNIQSLEVIA